MNVKWFILMEIVVQLYYVVSYTVVLKQVKPLYQPVKVYRYDLRQPKIISDGNLIYPYKPILSQKIYPVKEKNFRPRGVEKKGGKYVKNLSTEKPLGAREGRLYGISQQLVPPLSNQIEEYSDAKATVAEEVLKEDVDARPLPGAHPHEKSFASFPQEKGKIYKKAGEWATPVPNEDSENTTQSAFTPSQLYLQIRHKNTVIHVPQSEALKDAETLEELINAPRLKELARTTHVQETYSEEGYEDAAYDHAGQIRQAQHGEIYDARDEGRFKIKETPSRLEYDSDIEESKTPSPQEEMNKLEPRVTRSRTELRKTGIDYSKEPTASYKGEHLFSSRVKILKPTPSNESIHSFGPATFPSFFGEMPPPPETFTNDSGLSYMTPPLKISSKYRKEDLNSTKIYPVKPPTNKTSGELTDSKGFVSVVDSQPSPSAKSLKYSRIYSKKTKQLRLEPYKIGNVYAPPPKPTEHLQPPVEEREESVDQRIVLPTIGYINSLTTAHFGKELAEGAGERPNTELTTALNLTQALNYLRSNKDQKIAKEPKIFNETDLNTFEPMRLKKQRPHYRSFANKTKRDVYLMREQDGVSGQSEYEGNDEEDTPHNEKNLEISNDERERIEEENREKEKFETELREEITAKEKEIIKEAFRNIEDHSSESFAGDSSYEIPSRYKKSTTPSPVDYKKYPFYLSKSLPENSALRYASDPVTFPRKSGYGMEFYESRERLVQCPDFHPDFDDFSSSNSTEDSEAPENKNQRLTRLGDKISCLRSKYFDPEPFDNPIFKEREVDYVGKPKKGRKKFKGPQRKTATKAQKPLRTYEKLATPKASAKSEIRMSSIGTERPQTSGSVLSQVRINKNSEPIKVLPFVPLLNVASSPVKPETEISNRFSSFTTESGAKVKPPAGWETIFHTKSTTPHPAKIVLRKNCVHVITKMAALDGARNLTIECDDATLIQEILNGVAYVRIIPKPRWSAKISPKQPPNSSDWIPITGYSVPNFTKPLNRKTDEIKTSKNETTEKPSSDQYVIDELKEDKSIRQGEVVEDIDHYLKMTESDEMTTESAKTNRKRKRREAIDVKPKKGTRAGQRPVGIVVFDAIEKITQGQGSANNNTEEISKNTFSKLFQAKRTLGRLSGRDFLTRYHKNKSKPKTADFWKIAGANNKNVQKQPTTEKTSPSTFGEISQESSNSNVATKTNAFKEKPTGAEEHGTNFRNADLQTNPPPSFVADKVTKKTENALRMSEPFQNLTRLIAKVSKEVSERSEKPGIVHKVHESTSGKENTSKASKKPDVQYKTINRRKDYPKKAGPENSSPNDPILYYVMDFKTGRGKWITHYEEQRRSGKFRKTGKVKEDLGTRRDKKRKKTSY